jgi:predicted nucleic acid-binding protein
LNILLDSDIVIEVLRSRDHVIQSRWETLADSDRSVLYSPVTTAEIWAGARSQEQEETARFFQILTCAVTTQEIGELAGAFLRQYSKSHSLKIGDALIAAAAVQNRAQLWTRNRKHYPMPELSFY